MLLRICAEIVLAISTYAVARQFWACGKREQYLKQVMSNEAHLESFISHAVLESPSPAMDYFAQPNQAGYGINLEAASAADKGATYRVRAFTCVALSVSY